MKRLVFVGAQGTGKTTMLKKFEGGQFELITEVVRNLAKQGLPINQMGYIATQDKVYAEYYKLLTQQISYISDRGLVDVIAYTMEALTRAMNEGKDDRLSMFNLMAMQLAALLQFNADNPDVVYCYFPIEFDVVDDGTRSTDEEYRKTIDSNIRAILDWAQIDYLEIRGSVEEREATLRNMIDTMSPVVLTPETKPKKRKPRAKKPVE